MRQYNETGLRVMGLLFFAFSIVLLAGCGASAPTLPSPDGQEGRALVQGALDITVCRASGAGARTVSGVQVAAVYVNNVVVSSVETQAQDLQAVTDSNGHVWFENLTPGTYKVVAQDGVQIIEKTADVNLGQVTYVTLTFPPTTMAGSLEVCVHDPDGSPMSAHVVVTPAAEVSQRSQGAAAPAATQDLWEGYTPTATA